MKEKLYRICRDVGDLKTKICLATAKEDENNPRLKRQLTNYELIDNLRSAIDELLFLDRAPILKRIEISFDLSGEPSENQNLIAFIEDFIPTILGIFGNFEVSLRIKTYAVSYSDKALSFIQNFSCIVSEKFKGNGIVDIALNYGLAHKQKKSREIVTSTLEKIGIFQENLYPLRDKYVLEIMVGKDFFMPKSSKLSRLVSKDLFAIRLVGKNLTMAKKYASELKEDGWTVINEVKGDI